ncbi:MAG: DUF2459 domain-containing protein [Bacteroidota bacterium]
MSAFYYFYLIRPYPFTMKWMLRIFKAILIIVLIPVIAYGTSLILAAITINSSSGKGENPEKIYLSTNGRHIEIILHKDDIEPSLLMDLQFSDVEEYFSFAMGDSNFYLNIRTTENLTLKSTFEILFQKSSALIHLTRFKSIQSHWVEVKLTKSELMKVNELILETFKADENGNKIILPGASYGSNDNFYKSSRSYTCCYTCNTWANSIFKESGLKSCLWTPFDYGLLNKYK